MASSTDGSLTWMAWKRRCRAASRSTYLRYSSSVVAPMHCSSPRARAGFMMLEASIAPSAAPAPTSVCSSSMKRMTSPWRLAHLLHDALHALFELAAVLGAGDQGRQVQRDDALVLQEVRDVARDDALGQPSAMAVLPTPGSPSRHGLFLMRREMIWMTRSISLARPMTGSSFSLRASSVRSRPNSSRVGVRVLAALPAAAVAGRSRRRLPAGA